MEKGKREEIETVINQPLLAIKVLSFSLFWFFFFSFQFYIPWCQIKKMTWKKSHLHSVIHRKVTYFKNANILWHCTKEAAGLWTLKHSCFFQTGCMVIQGGSTPVTCNFIKNCISELFSELGFVVLSRSFAKFCICKDETRTGSFGLGWMSSLPTS